MGAYFHCTDSLLEAVIWYKVYIVTLSCKKKTVVLPQVKYTRWRPSVQAQCFKEQVAKNYTTTSTSHVKNNRTRKTYVVLTNS